MDDDRTEEVDRQLDEVYVWTAILGQGWVVAADVGDMVGCSERHARRFLRRLHHNGKVEVIPGGERGRGDLWRALSDPYESMTWDLDQLIRIGSSAMVGGTGLTRREIGREVVRLANRLRETCERIFN